MLKTQAIELLGGSVADAARLIGVTSQAINQWGDVLSAKQADRVQAALWRIQQAKKRKASKPAAEAA